PGLGPRVARGVDARPIECPVGRVEPQSCVEYGSGNPTDDEPEEPLRHGRSVDGDRRRRPSIRARSGLIDLRIRIGTNEHGLVRRIDGPRARSGRGVDVAGEVGRADLERMRAVAEAGEGLWRRAATESTAVERARKARTGLG